MRWKTVFFFALMGSATLLHAQNQREVYGSFTAGCKVFNYHLKASTNHIFAFTIYETGKEFQLLDLEESKLNATDSFLTNLIVKLDSTIGQPEVKDSIKQVLTAAKPVLKELIAILKDAYPKVSAVNALGSKQASIESLVKKNKDALIDSVVFYLNGREPGPSYYSFSEMLEALSSMVDILKGSAPQEYLSFHELKLDVFEAIFNDRLRKKITHFPATCPADRNLSSKVFYEIKARLDFFDDEPVTAYLKLRSKNLKVFISTKTTDPENKKNNSDEKGEEEEPKKKTGAASATATRPYWATLRKNKDYLEFSVENVQAEFEDGTLKNLFVDLVHTPDNKEPITVRFRNNIPVSVSAKFSPDDFDDQRIYAGIPCQLYRALYNRGVNSTAQNLQRGNNPNESGGCRELFFLLSDLLEYQIVAENDKEDYSPANHVYNLNEQNPIQQLKKEKRSRILVLKAFSDFVGVRDDQPNGLIQFEVSKRINLKTSPVQQSQMVYWNWLSYVEPRAVFSKIERNNKYLHLNRQSLDSVETKGRNAKLFYVNPLQLLRYANFSFQTDLNLFRLNIPQGKSNFQLNGRVGYFRTAVSDSLNIIDSTISNSVDLKTDDINSGFAGLGIIWEMKPDSRFGLSFNYEVSLLKAFSTNYQINGSFKNKLVQSFGFDGYLKTNNEGGRLFFRTRLNNLFANAKENFIQIQLGYAANIFKTN